MAMNKKEQELVEELKKQVRLAKALRWTEPVKKDVPIPTYEKDSTGFVFNTYGPDVRPAWSSSVSHGVGYASRQEGRSASQNPISMYSTRLLALKALRNAVEIESAEKLAKIDRMIEDEIGGEESP